MYVNLPVAYATTSVSYPSSKDFWFIMLFNILTINLPFEGYSRNMSCGRFRKKLYDKKDDFNFPIVNSPFIYSNIPAAPAYWIYIYLLILYSRACGSYQDFLDTGLLLTMKLLNQGFLWVKLKSLLRKFYGRHHDLIDRYGISTSQMTTDMFHLS